MTAKIFFPFIIVLSLFLILVSPHLLSDGMFVDGLTYATISRNLAYELGTPWQLHYTQTLAPVFYGHLPFAIWMQAICFELWGDSILVERFYGLMLYLLTGWTIVLIWKEVTGGYRYGWLPLLCWISVPEVIWACANNVLENTMTFFACLSVLFCLKYVKKDQLGFIMLSGIILFCAVFSKGPTALFILALPFSFWLFVRDYRMRSLITGTALLVFFTVVPLIIIWAFLPGGVVYLSNYFEDQLVHSIKNVQTVPSRFAIIHYFLKNIIPLSLIFLITIIASRKLELKIFSSNPNLPHAKIFLLLAICGVLPVMISLKQSSFYILGMYPFMALGIALIILPLVQSIVTLSNPILLKYNLLRSSTVGIMLFSLVLNFLQMDRIGRDDEKVIGALEIIKVVGDKQVLGAEDLIWQDWSLHGYLARYGQVSLEYSGQRNHEYFLSCEDCKPSGHSMLYPDTILKTGPYLLLKM